MKRFLKWRKMTWALLLWGALIGLWIVSGTFGIVSGTLGPALAVGALGLIALSFVWFMTIPLWRQSH